MPFKKGKYRQQGKGTWNAELNIAMGKGAEAKANVIRMVDHIISEGCALPNVKAHCGGHPPLPSRPRGGDCSEGRSGSRRQAQRAAKACQTLSESRP